MVKDSSVKSFHRTEMRTFNYRRLRQIVSFGEVGWPFRKITTHAGRNIGQINIPKPVDTGHPRTNAYQA